MARLDFYEEATDGQPDRVVLSEFIGLARSADEALSEGALDVLAHLSACAKMDSFDETDPSWTGRSDLYCYVDSLKGRVAGFYSLIEGPSESTGILVVFSFCETQSALPSRRSIALASSRMDCWSDR